MIRAVVLLCLGVGAIQAMDLRAGLENVGFLPMWFQFKETHNKSYEHPEEEAKRFEVFVENHRMIEEHNKEFAAGRKTYTMAMNQYGDMTKEEFQLHRKGLKMPEGGKRVQGVTFMAPLHAQVPTQVDWREKGYVSSVKDQGQCGSCYTFSAAGALEGQHFRKTGKMIDLSEQNLVDCSWSQGNQGCNGGLMDNAFTYVQSNGGVDTERSYPYEARRGRCRYNKRTVGAQDVGFSDIPEGDEDALEAALATVGPISIAVDASSDTFRFYEKGVYYEPMCSSTQLDHGILAVGYGVTENGEKYYIVKNSWGAQWGENGYIRMAKGRNNHCGIATMASYPLV